MKVVTTSVTQYRKNRMDTKQFFHKLINSFLLIISILFTFSTLSMCQSDNSKTNPPKSNRMRQFIIITILFSLSAFSCSTITNSSSDVNTNQNQIIYNNVNSITGIYSKAIVSQKNTSEHSGIYKIVTSDSLEIILLPPYMEESKRPTNEILKFEGKKVIVRGIIVEQTDLSEPTIEKQPLSVNIPCFITINEIKLAE